MICPECGTFNPEGTEHCACCYARLTTSAPTTPPAENHNQSEPAPEPEPAPIPHTPQYENTNVTLERPEKKTNTTLIVAIALGACLLIAIGFIAGGMFGKSSEKESQDFIEKSGDGYIAPQIADEQPDKRFNEAEVTSVDYDHYYSYIVSHRVLSYSELMNLSAEELRILRNTIFAIHGRKFRDQKLREYFLSMPWYEPLYDDVPINSFSEIEQENLTNIQKFESHR